ncbi:TPA: BspA family leucine-rich repeat surface protein [Campylobacter jejuni]|nr:BspA family leucine-rich repeat surface protein [Campylobacter jejuni]
MAKFTPKTKEELQALVEDESIYLGDIDTSKITDMSCLFRNSTREDFSGIEKWDVSNVKDMASMFAACKNFNQDLSSWDTSNVKTMAYMFADCENFNQDISGWDVGKVRNMEYMFKDCKSFNQPLGDWDVSEVENMRGIFLCCESFNQDLSSWDVSKVKTMAYMFAGCESFNQDISGWNVSNVANMYAMFSGCENFNQDLSSWDVSSVEYMDSMFYDCENFNQDLSSWDMSNVKDINMFENYPIDNSNKPKELQELFYDNMNLEEVEIILSKLPKDLVFQALYKQEIMYKIDNDENEYEVDEKIINKSVKELYNKYIDDFSDTPMLNEHWLDELVEITDEIAEEQAEQKDKIKNKKGLK